MFAAGDQVVCIKPFCSSRRPKTRPQVGCVYTVGRVCQNPWWPDMVGITLMELPSDAPSGCRWAWLIEHFRKVTKFEEPRRKVVEAPKEPELVPA